MLRREDWLMIRELREKGAYIKDIAAQLGVHPRTVSRALARGAAPSGKRPNARKSKLDPFKPLVDDLLAQGVWNAVVIFRELQARGYQGGISILRDYIHPKRPLRPSRATVRFETAPGRQLQHDWAEIRTEIAGRCTKVYFAVNTLGYSRRFHFWAAPRKDAHHSFESLVRAFEYFGGVPREVLVDNEKIQVLSHPHRGNAVFHPAFLALANHYGFTPRACRPYRARTKGKDERVVGYIKQHFFVRYRQFEGFPHLNQQAEQWLRDEADRRLHGTTREIVIERFAREQPHLEPLPPRRFDTSYRETRWVAWDAYVDVRGNRYSVPAHLCGQQVIVRIGLDGTLRVFAGEGEELVATHHLRPASEGWVRVPEHHQALWHEALCVQQRDLSVYEEVARCN